MNLCIFTGHTTRDIELRYTQNNISYGKFSLAVTTGHGDNRKTHFFNMTAWGKTAETMSKYVTKGKKIMVECEANQNQYKDKNRNNVNAVDFRVEGFEFCESKNASQQSNESRPQQPQQSDLSDFMSIPADIDDTELPFS